MTLLHTRDKAATLGNCYADPRSYVTLDGHEHLEGADMTMRRREVYIAAEARCWKCGEVAGWDRGELDHIVGGLGPQRCDCRHNLRWACHKHHTGDEGRHVRTHLSKV